MDKDRDDLNEVEEHLQELLDDTNQPITRTDIPRIIASVIGLSSLLLVDAIRSLHQSRLLATPIHNAPESGLQKIDRMLESPNPNTMRGQIGVSPHIFMIVLEDLETTAGLGNSCYIQAREKLGIFLYIICEGLGLTHTATTFNRSLDTCSRYVCLKVLAEY